MDFVNMSSSQVSNSTSADESSKVASQPLCGFCGQTFASDSDLREHVVIHKKEKPFECSFCDMRYKDFYEFSNHLRTLHSKRPFRLKIGEVTYSNDGGVGSENLAIEDLWNNQTGKTSSTHYQCMFCSESLSQQHLLFEHVKQHFGTTYKCYFCEKRFPREDLRNKHLKRMHADRDVDTVKDKGANSELDPILQDVIIQVTGGSVLIMEDKADECANIVYRPPVKPKPPPRPPKPKLYWQCTFCNKTFDMKQNYIEHALVHTGEKPYECVVCGARYRQRSAVIKHARSSHKDFRGRRTHRRVEVATPAPKMTNISNPGDMPIKNKGGLNKSKNKGGRAAPGQGKSPKRSKPKTKRPPNTSTGGFAERPGGGGGGSSSSNRPVGRIGVFSDNSVGSNAGSIGLENLENRSVVGSGGFVDNSVGGPVAGNGGGLVHPGGGRPLLGTGGFVDNSVRSTIGSGGFVDNPLRSTVGNGGFMDYGIRPTVGNGGFMDNSVRSAVGSGGFVDYGIGSTVGNGGFIDYGVRPTVGNGGFVDYGLRSAVGNAGFVDYGIRPPVGNGGFIDYSVRSAVGSGGLVNPGIGSVPANSGFVNYSVSDSGGLVNPSSWSVTGHGGFVDSGIRCDNGNVGGLVNNPRGTGGPVVGTVGGPMIAHHGREMDIDDGGDYMDNDSMEPLELSSHHATDLTKMLPCTFCMEKFPNKSLLHDHMATHTFENHYACTLCEMRFAHPSSLDNHVKTAHGGRQERKSTTTKSRSSRKHLRGLRKCFTFTEGVFQRTEGGKHTYSCDLCNKSFTIVSSLRRHVRDTHAGCPIHKVVPVSQRENGEKVVGEKWKLLPKDESGPKKRTSAEIRDIQIISDKEVLPVEAEDPNAKCECRQDSTIVCTLCNKVFKHTKTLQTHMKEHATCKFQCVLCNKMFWEELKLKNHISRNHRGGRGGHFKCHLCAKEFTHFGAYTYHKNTVHNNVCPVHGSKKVPGQTGLTESAAPDSSVETGPCSCAENQFPCTQCGQVFSKRSSLRDHMASHMQYGKIFRCELCGKGFKLARDCLRHEKTLHKTECTYCGKKLVSATKLKEHMARVHKYENDGPFKCDVCGKEFRHFYKYEKHKNAAHITCPVHKRMWSSSAPTQKTRLNSESCRTGGKSSAGKCLCPKYPCTICSKLFSTQNNLTEHMVRHTHEGKGKPFKCDLCGMGFMLSRHCRRHQNSLHITCPTHKKVWAPPSKAVAKTMLAKQNGKDLSKTETAVDGDTKPENEASSQEKSDTGATGTCLCPMTDCPFCGKVFSTPGFLLRHISLHKRVSDNHCPYCSRQFETQTALRLHVKVGHKTKSRKEYQCDQCELSFRTIKECSRHVMTVHKGRSKPKRTSKPPKLYVLENVASAKKNVIVLGRKSADGKIRPHDASSAESKDVEGLEDTESHDGGRQGNHQCPVCNKTFNRKAYLSEHMMGHGGERPYKCILCDWRFSYQASVCRHVKSVHRGCSVDEETGELKLSRRAKAKMASMGKLSKIRSKVSLKESAAALSKTLEGSSSLPGPDSDNVKTMMGSEEIPVKSTAIDEGRSDREGNADDDGDVDTKVLGSTTTSTLSDGGLDGEASNQHSATDSKHEVTNQQTGCSSSKAEDMFLDEDNDDDDCPQERSMDSSATDATTSPNKLNTSEDCTQSESVIADPTDATEPRKDHPAVKTTMAESASTEEREVVYDDVSDNDGDDEPSACEKSMDDDKEKVQLQLDDQLKSHVEGEEPLAGETKSLEDVKEEGIGRSRIEKIVMNNELVGMRMNFDVFPKIEPADIEDSDGGPACDNDDNNDDHEQIADNADRQSKDAARNDEEDDNDDDDDDGQEQRKPRKAVKLSSFQCSLCKKLFVSESYLDKHRLTHTNSLLKYSCKFCCKKFKHSIARNLHMRVAHKGVVVDSKERYNTVMDEDDDEEDFSTDDERMDYSNIADSSSASQKGGKHHNAPYQCAFCKKTYMEARGFQEHVRSHTGEKPHKCDYCDKTFNYRRCSQRHMVKIHKVVIKRKAGRPRLNRSDPDQGIKSSRPGSGLLSWANISDRSSKRKWRKKGYRDLFQCVVCNKTFKSRSRLEAHAVSHTNERPHQCDTCGKTFKSVKGLRSHELYIHVFNSEYQMFKKSITAADDNNKKPVSASKRKRSQPYRCHFCNETFPINIGDSKFQEHIRSHTGERPHTCDLCGKSFNYMRCFKRHMRNVHQELLPADKAVVAGMNDSDSVSSDDSDEEETICKSQYDTSTKYKCYFCQEVFKTAVCRFKHVKKAHKGCVLPEHEMKEKGLFLTKKHKRVPSMALCSICGKLCAPASRLKNHMLKHVNERKKRLKRMQNMGDQGAELRCGVCSKTFPESQQSRFEEHLRTHSQETPFKCDYCHVKFKHEASIKSHLRVRERRGGICPEKSITKKERKYECKICGKKVTQHYNLQLHMRIHTGETPYRCDYCGGDFRWRSTLRKHVQTMHKGLPVPPPIPVRPSQVRFEPNEPEEVNRPEVPLATTNNNNNTVMSDNGGQRVCENDPVEDEPACFDALDESHASWTDNDDRGGGGGYMGSAERTSAVPLLANQDNVPTFPFRGDNSSAYLPPFNQDNMVKPPVYLPGNQHLLSPDYQDKVKNLILEGERAALYLADKVTSFASLGGSSSSSSTAANVHTHHAPPTDQGNKRHYKSDQKLPCDYCGKVFPANNLAEHMLRHTGERPPHQCHLCESRYLQRSALLRHWKTVHKVAVPQPPDGMLLGDTNNAGHQQNFQEEAPPLSSSSKRTKGSKKSSDPQGHPQEMFKCNFCDKQYTRKSDYNNHLRWHTGEVPYQCDFCHTRFRTVARIHRHLKIRAVRGACPLVTTAEAAAPPPPPKQDDNNMAAFMNNATEMSSIPTAAPVASSSTNHAAPLKSDGGGGGGVARKGRSKPGEGGFKCTICDRSFPMLRSYEEHMRWHTGERPHRCDLCGKKFNYLRCARKHLLNVHNLDWKREEAASLIKTNEDSTAPQGLDSSAKRYEQPKEQPKESLIKKGGEFKAPGESFIKKSGEFSTPTGTGPIDKNFHIKGNGYQCYLCDRSFPQLRSYEEHIRWHTGERPNRCHLCGKTFNYLRNQRKHMLTVHNYNWKLHKDASEESDGGQSSSTSNNSTLASTSNLIHAADDGGNEEEEEEEEEDDDDYLCTECGESFSQESMFQEHIRSHAIHYQQQLQAAAASGDDGRGMGSGSSSFGEHHVHDQGGERDSTRSHHVGMDGRMARAKEPDDEDFSVLAVIDLADLSGAKY